jgi:hypothetical protein
LYGVPLRGSAASSIFVGVFGKWKARGSHELLPDVVLCHTTPLSPMSSRIMLRRHSNFLFLMTTLVMTKHVSENTSPSSLPTRPMGRLPMAKHESIVPPANAKIASPFDACKPQGVNAGSAVGRSIFPLDLGLEGLSDATSYYHRELLGYQRSSR